METEKLGIENVKITFHAIAGMVKELKGKGLDIIAILFALRNLLPVRLKKVKAELADLDDDEKDELIAIFTEAGLDSEKCKIAIEKLVNSNKIKLVHFVKNLLK